MSVAIDRISLHLPPMSEEEARRVAEQVARALGRLPVDVDRTVEGVTATVTPARANEALAEQIARAVLRELA
jgi:hypothetical protein